jgi:hypothetical protein
VTDPEPQETAPTNALGAHFAAFGYSQSVGTVTDVFDDISAGRKLATVRLPSGGQQTYAVLDLSRVTVPTREAP